jgi:hypothetical protein
MDFPGRRFVRIALGIVALVTVFLFLANGHFFYSDNLPLILTICMTASYSIAAAVAFEGARRVGARSYLGSAFITIGVGMASMAVGFLVEDYYKFVAQTEIPYPSLADAFFFLYTPLVVIGLWMFLKIHSMRVTRRLVVEASAITAGSIALSFVFLGTLTLGKNMSIFSFLAGRTVDIAEVLAESMSILYLVTDAIYVALAVLIARVSGGKMSFGLFLFAVGIALMTAGDVAYSIVVENGTYLEGDVSDQLFLASGLAQAIGLTFVIRPFVERFSASARGPEKDA